MLEASFCWRDVEYGALCQDKSCNRRHIRVDLNVTFVDTASLAMLELIVIEQHENKGCMHEVCWDNRSILHPATTFQTWHAGLYRQSITFGPKRGQPEQLRSRRIAKERRGITLR